MPERFRLLTKTPFSAFKASLGLRLGCGHLLGAFWTGDQTETDVSTLALLSLGEKVLMARLIIPEDFRNFAKTQGCSTRITWDRVIICINAEV